MAQEQELSLNYIKAILKLSNEFLFCFGFGEIQLCFIQIKIICIAWLLQLECNLYLIAMQTAVTL